MMDILMALKWKKESNKLLILAILDISVLFFQLLPFCTTLSPEAIIWHSKKAEMQMGGPQTLWAVRSERSSILHNLQLWGALESESPSKA